MSEIVEAGVTGLAQLYRQGETNPVTVCDHYLTRIAQFDGAIRAFVDIDYRNIEQAAAASAARWAQNHPRSPLDGVPLAVKSNIAVAGLPWTAGVGAYRDRIAAADAHCVALLREAGAIILGTVNMHEAALGATTDNPWFGRTMNPFRDGYTPGGSSGGSAAAVAAGFCAAALGTDTFGSIRIPASYCGVFGYKPRYGVVSTDGIVPLAPSLDTVGVLARSAADCRAVMAVLGDVLTDDDQPDIAVPGTNFDPDAFDRFMQPALFVAEAEGAVVYDALLKDPSQALSPSLRKMFGWALKQPPAALAEARAELAAAKELLSAHIDRVGCIITPTTPSVAHRFGDPGERDAARFTLAASLCGLPAIAVPMGVDGNGLPLSIQIVGRDAALILRLADKLAIQATS